MKQTEFDAIVVGTGISGGWAAKELCEKGLKTLVLERGRMVNHPDDYITANMDPWDLPFGGQPTQEDIKNQEKQHRTGYTTQKTHSHYFVNDLEHPYNEVKRFDWMRGYHVGGRSLMWGRQSYRLSDFDFEANKKDGHGVDWPIRYKDIAPWYDYVENYIGVSGENLGLPQLPDGQFLKPMELNCVETHLKDSIGEHFEDRLLTIGRVAHITEGTKPGKGRVNCQYRNRCMRGCPFGGYFSSNSSTLPAAEESGNMTLRPNSIVHQVIYDKDKKKAIGVSVIDTETKKTYEYKAKVIFLCASAIASTSILMQSKSDRFPNGMGNDSGELGHNLMDHHFKAGAYGTFDGFEDMYYKGRRPNGIYIPRFRNLGGDTNQKDFLRGYGYQGGASKDNWQESVAELGYGQELKEAIIKPGGWSMGLMGFGECLPYHENKMYLDYDKLDSWGLPTVTFDAEWKENEWKMRKDMIQQAMEMLEKAGFKNISPMDSPGAPGLGIHEMGTARMGRDPKTSVLNKYNQVHAVPNVFVTDGAAMTSAGCQNPSLTYMALTARAANYAAEQLKKETYKPMIMNRREAVKKLGLGAGFLVASPTIVNLLQSCTGEPGFVPAFVNEREGKALIQIVDLILPSDKEIPGAKELGIYEFVDAYWKEMLPVEEQIFVRLGWTSLNNIFSANFGKNISKGSSEEWDQILSKFLKSSKEEQEAYDKSNEDFVETLRKDNSAKPNDEAAAYAILSAVREMTIWGWKTNKTIGTKVLWYDPVPGRQDACLPQDQVGNGRAMSLNW